MRKGVKKKTCDHFLALSTAGPSSSSGPQSQASSACGQRATRSAVEGAGGPGRESAEGRRKGGGGAGKRRRERAKEGGVEMCRESGVEARSEGAARELLPHVPAWIGAREFEGGRKKEG